MKMSANSRAALMISTLQIQIRNLFQIQRGAHVLAPGPFLVSLQICGNVYFGARDDLINQTVDSENLREDTSERRAEGELQICSQSKDLYALMASKNP